MSTDTKVSELIINKLTKAQYDSITTKSDSELYFITDDNESFVSTVNGVAPVNGNVTIDIPTKTSDLTNDAGYITKAVNNLDNYTTTTDMNTLLSGKQDSLTTEQLAAVNSGITATKVSTYDGYATGKQDTLTTDQLAAVNSGITADKVSTYDGYATTIAGKADKATTLAGYGIEDAYTKTEVDSKLTSVYKYKGSVATYADLPTEGNVQGDVYNVQTADAEHGIAAGDNVAWVAATETEEGHWDRLGGTVDLTNYYTKTEVNTELAKKQDNLTTDQLAAVNSGITSTKVSSYDTHIADSDIHVTAAQKTEWSGKQDALTTDQLAAVNSGITATKVSTYDGYATGKQDALTTDQLAAVNSGITATKVAAYDAYDAAIQAKQDTITGAATTVVSDNLTADRVVISNANGKIAVSTVTSTEVGYLSGVTSAVQTQLNAKVDANASIEGATHTKITYDSKGLVTAGTDLSADDIPSLTLAKISDVTSTAAELNELHEAGAVKADFEKLHAVTVSATEINYLDGVTSKVQDQLDSKAAVTIRQW